MIDNLTVARIMEAADIYDVVSDFVSLKKAGANYKGLCPFHNDRTPSFFVSRAKGYCKCFSCGKGGNAVGFIMEHEQLSYPDALRYLARKYGIEIKERELTDEEKDAQMERESLFLVNEWAANYFEKLLHESQDGATVGLPYFRTRGFRDDIIRKFKLGYDPSDRHALARTAQAKGYKAEHIEKAGLCYKTDRGELIDRFSGRVIFPWFTLSGKIVGFGGRLLDARTKGVAQKYVNSPESEIYHKDSELYGIFQARKAIARENRVYVVEGYTDVISMHQCGIENVVANSGTALSERQINILHRLTQNITLLYDGDAAGIKAAMRGTDMILAHGMNIKVLILPDGDDPDSFARKHTAEEFRAYVEEHQVDFFDFKCSLMLNGVTDPIQRSEAVESVLRSISLIPDPVTRSMYVKMCAPKLQLKEEITVSRINKFIKGDKDQRLKAEARQQELNAMENKEGAATPAPSATTLNIPSPQSKLQEVESLIVRQIIMQGETILPVGNPHSAPEEGEMEDGIPLACFVERNLAEDNIIFSEPIYNTILAEAAQHATESGFNSLQYFMRHENLEINQVAAQFMMEQQPVAADNTAEDNRTVRILNNINHLLIDLRFQIVSGKLEQAKQRLSTAKGEEMADAMRNYQQLKTLLKQISSLIGRTR
ncbi:MAG: DNA primase [Bacteroidaceae bacterium]|nr:DNA primase [Bacteroidaceae bacterium]